MLAVKNTGMQNLLIRKLDGYVPLTEEDKQHLDRVIQNPRHVAAHVDLIREGQQPDDVYLILEGYACRYKITADGKRQIMAYLVPGDFCDLHVFVLKQMDHNLGTLSPCTVVNLPRPTILKLLQVPNIARAMWYASLVDSAVLREWLVNVGQRSGEERVAHVLCELLVRLRAVGLAQNGAFQLPITQNELGDTTGLSTVHVNRVLQSLRHAGLISWKGEDLVILDQDKLFEFAGFTPNYLHIHEQNGSKAQHV